jgi:hypothetical protein
MPLSRLGSASNIGPYLCSRRCRKWLQLRIRDRNHNTAQKTVGDKMPSIQWNTFIDKHKTRFCIMIRFRDYAELRKKVKGPITTTDGKEFPTPNALLKAMAKLVKSDYTIKSGPVSQIIMISDKSEAEQFANAIGGRQWAPGNMKPCSAMADTSISHKEMVELSKKLRLL